jgi:hypothetical protein
MRRQLAKAPSKLVKRTGRHTTTGTTTESRGRIQFHSTHKDNLPIYLCDECKESHATCRCDVCQLLYCIKCNELAHISIKFGEIHSHIRFIRPITEDDIGACAESIDTSSLVLPNSYVYEEDIQQHVNITTPDSLCSHTILTNKSNQIYTYPKYQRGDVVIFVNPLLDKECFGKIISNVDIIHSNEYTIPILRGQDSIVYYEIIILESMENVRAGVKQLLKNTDEDVGSNIQKQHVDDITNIQERQYLYLAMDLNSKAKVAKQTHSQLQVVEYPSVETINKSNMVVMSETSLLSPLEKWNILEKERKQSGREYIVRILHTSRIRIQKVFFHLWYQQSLKILLHLRIRSCILIQSIIRRMIAKIKLTTLRHEFQMELHSKWSKVREKFKFSSIQDPTAVTMDGRLFFNTLADVNKYYATLKRNMLKCCFHMNRRILFIYKEVCMYVLRHLILYFIV